MAERRIRLDVGTSALPGDRLAQHDSSPRQTPDDEARDRFERALAHDGDAKLAPAPTRADSPFALFGNAAAGQVSPVSGQEGDQDGSHDLAPLRDAIEKLMVGEGRGGALVRVALADSLLPGVTISVSEEGGGWRVECECADEDSRELLCARAASLAQNMADRLARDTLWCVMTDDPEDRRLLEVRAAAGGTA